MKFIKSHAFKSVDWSKQSVQHSKITSQTLPSRPLHLRCSALAQPSSNGHVQNGASQSHNVSQWDRKADLYLLRSDGHSCARETVTAEGSVEFEHPTSQQQLLVWKTRPKRVLVLKKIGDELMNQLIEVLHFLGEEEGLEVVIEEKDYNALNAKNFNKPWLLTYADQDIPDLHTYIDFVICLGGDGTILHASHLFGDCIPPIIAFKLGSMGFLTCHDYGSFKFHLSEVINGSHELATCRLTNSIDGAPLLGMHITLRMRLQCEIYRNGRPLPGHRYNCMNEVVLARGGQPYLSKIEVYERNELITKVQADGVMLATPTGSTAYSIAAGGSMVHPNVPAILFTPICPHSLSFRPVILPDYAELELRIASNARSSALATFDGKYMVEMEPGDSVHVKLSPHPVPTINNRDQTVDWFASIERCFKWNDRLEQKELTNEQKMQAAAERARKAETTA